MEVKVRSGVQRQCTEVKSSLNLEKDYILGKQSEKNQLEDVLFYIDATKF